MNTAERALALYTWLTVHDVAERQGVSEWVVRQWIASGQLKARNMGTAQRKWWKVKHEWLEEFERQRTVG